LANSYLNIIFRYLDLDNKIACSKNITEREREWPFERSPPSPPQHTWLATPPSLLFPFPSYFLLSLFSSKKKKTTTKKGGKNKTTIWVINPIIEKTKTNQSFLLPMSPPR
jgi:hypothetical protein